MLRALTLVQKRGQLFFQQASQEVIAKENGTLFGDGEGSKMQTKTLFCPLNRTYCIGGQKLGQKLHDGFGGGAFVHQFQLAGGHSDARAGHR